MNYPQGSQHAQDAPWNDTPRHKEWQAWYVFVEGPDEDNHTMQLEIYFPAWCQLFDARILARSYCIDHRMGFVDIEPEEETHLTVTKTNTYYE